MTYMVLRLLLSLFVSGVLAIITMYGSFLFVISLASYVPVLEQIGLMIEGLLGIPVVMVLATIFFFGVYMIFFEWRKYRYLAQVHRSVSEIAEGNFGRQVPVKNNSEVAEIAVTINDLVSRLVNAMEEERKAERAKNELVTNVSHDLRTPLTSIIGYLGLIEQDRYRDEVELRHYVQIAYTKSRRLQDLIQDLFDYTRLRHEGNPLRLDSLNLVELIGQLLEQYRLSMEEAGLTSELRSDDKRIVVPGDAGKLVRVFENLISNAIKYGGGGHVVQVQLRRDRGFATVEITNDGEPIPESDLPYIFDRFYRVDKSRTETSGGSGLGLAICKSIVERHGGSIDASSRTGQTTFRVRLPLVT
ncbi:sensor histidine kinase [Paenibacillus daejeonensis]|uniref:sensor histidine kinase n=1 Tax=Paenibacillus daejeonensis TaxID=135193 RepID=UPI00037DAD7E|nr:HAMP domain-containing sensor histidine kinase [Paenibacillus daejeonensis]